ncbi:unnamed protein product [Durusdinium trenchii]|uniref:EF-hand domain-containing protein n=1 Tax=Durusdinium trenchii TaxID=1381693 RepID=A0ABP0K0T6_9DINO
MPTGGYTMSFVWRRQAVFGSSGVTFPTRGARLANAGMQQMTPRPQINTRGEYEDVENTFKFWVSGSEAGRKLLWSAWEAIDYNGNGLVSLAEIDKWVVESYPKLNNKPALMRAYKSSDLDHNSYVTKREFPVLLRNVIYFNKVWTVFETMDVDADRRLAFPEFRQGLSLLGMTSVVNPRSLFDSLDRNQFEVAEKKIQTLLKDTRQLNQLWRTMGYNGNGLVSLAEMDGCVTEEFKELNNKPALMRAYKATLRNADGYVHKTDFRVLLRNMFYFNKLYTLYEIVDHDHDRRMDLTEFRSGVSFLGLKLTPSQAFDKHRDQDANGGGMVLFDEFCKWAAAKKLLLGNNYNREDQLVVTLLLDIFRRDIDSSTNAQIAKIIQWVSRSGKREQEGGGEDILWCYFGNMKNIKPPYEGAGDCGQCVLQLPRPVE